MKCLESSLELAFLNRTLSVSFIGITNEKVYNFTSHRYVSFLSFWIGDRVTGWFWTGLSRCFYAKDVSEN